MPVVRVKKRENPYVQLERETVRISDLSLKATGLWCLAMSYPDDWEFNYEHLTKQKKDGHHAFKTAFQELKDVGLASLEIERNEDGTLAGKQWYIYEDPTDNPKITSSVTDRVISRPSENPVDGGIADYGIKNKEDVSSTMNQNEERTHAREKSPYQPELEKVLAYAPTLGVSEAMAEEFYDYYDALGWELGEGRPIKRWKPKLKAWKARQHKFTTNGKPTHKQKTNGQSKDDPAQQFGHYYDVAMRALGD